MRELDLKFIHRAETLAEYGAVRHGVKACSCLFDPPRSWALALKSTWAPFCAVRTRRLDAKQDISPVLEEHCGPESGDGSDCFRLPRRTLI